MPRIKVLGVLVGAVLMVLVVAGSAFAADPYASAIATATSTTVSDFQSMLADIVPVLLGLAVAGLIVRRGLRFVR